MPEVKKNNFLKKTQIYIQCIFLLLFLKTFNTDYRKCSLTIVHIVIKISTNTFTDTVTEPFNQIAFNMIYACE
jgi:hypothetical protein